MTDRPTEKLIFHRKSNTVSVAKKINAADPLKLKS